MSPGSNPNGYIVSIGRIGGGSEGGSKIGRVVGCVGSQARQGPIFFRGGATHYSYGEDRQDA